MAVYTRPDAGALAALIRAHELGRIEALEPIAAGLENSNFLLHSPRGRFVLTLVESQDMDTALVRLRWLASLADAGLPVAAPRRTRTGALALCLQDRPAVLTPFVAGQVVTHPDERQCRAVGRFLGRLHRQPHPPELPPSEDPPALARRLEALRPQLPAELDHQWREALDELGHAGWTALPQAPLHGDLFRDNALFGEDHLVAVLDFYAAGRGPRLLDVAIAACDWCRDPEDRMDAARLAALLEGYGETVAVTAAERTAWPALLRFAALSFWIGRVAHRLQVGPRADKAPEVFQRLYHQLQRPGLRLPRP